MKKITLPDTSFKVSRISFGTASLHHIFLQKNRRKLIQKTIAHGISHFDTSPYYGYGLAEKQLGMLDSITKHEITIATKVGIYPPRLSSSILPPWFIKTYGKLNRGITKPIIDFSIEKSEKSLNDSLKRLKREYVNILFLHEPNKFLIDTEEFLLWQERIIKQGKVIHFGLAGLVDNFINLSNLKGLSNILQVQDSLKKKEADLVVNTGRKLQFTYGYLSSESKNKKTFSPEVTLKAALRRNSYGSILISTRKAEHIELFENVVANDENN